MKGERRKEVNPGFLPEKVPISEVSAKKLNTVAFMGMCFYTFRFSSPDMNPSRPLPSRLAAILRSSSLMAATLCLSLPLQAQQAANKPAEKPAAEQKDPTALPEVIVSAPKLSGDLLKMPVSATVVSGEVIEQNAIRTVKDAAIYAPNTFFTEFSARKLSAPRFRGIGASPVNPGVTTYYDGVPQFNGNSSSLELLDVEQVDFIRGPAGALFGRNTVGGLININSRRPALDAWQGGLESTFGNYNLYDVRGNITGPLIQDELGFSFAGGYNQRDGYTRNLVQGNDIDSRGAYFGKAQFLWTPTDELEIRLILAGETARDGDYALNDLAQLRYTPRRTFRDFEGYTERDVFMPTLQVTYHADAFDFTSTTGFVWWETQDLTDLDYSIMNFTGFGLPMTQPSFLIRNNHEEQRTYTQEFRFSSPADSPIILGEHASLAWQAGLFMFYQEYDQQVTQYQDGAFAPLPVFPFFAVLPPSKSGSASDLRDMGLGLYAQGTLTLFDRLDITAGLRYDYEDKDADLFLFNEGAPPVIAPANIRTQLRDSYSQVTPQAAITYRITPDLAAYASFAGGYKAGGFNPGVVGGAPQIYGEENSWNYEIGFKGRALKDRLSFSAAFFYTDWQNLQLNVPVAAANFAIVNAGDATSKGLELALNYRVTEGWDIFGSAGWQDARFRAGSRDGGANIGNNQVPYTPDYTITGGTQFNWNVGGGYNLYARGDVQFIGSYNYDSINAQAQGAYTLANIRVGVRKDHWFVEGFVNNAFDTEYVPIALPLPTAASGYVGENGAPLTFGVRVGVKF